MASIVLRDVEKRFKDNVVIKKLDLTVDEGEFFTLLGPSGCGKSTLLNLIAGLEELTSGSIFFDEQRVNDLPAGKRDVAMVFQSYALYPHLSVFENLAFPLRVRRYPKNRIRTEVKQVAAVLGLTPLLARRPKELSGGQRQRVALGRALVRKPQIFLMDEPLSNLDAKLRLEMREELKRLHRRYPVTTVYVTHDQEEAMALSDRIAILEKGVLQQCGAPQEIYRRPANLFVAEFVGSPPINLIERRIAEQMNAFAPVLKNLDGRDCLLGVRPSDIRVTAAVAPSSLNIEVSFLEPTGNDTWVIGTLGEQVFRGRAAEGESLKIGVSAHFHIPLDHVYVFDRVTGARLG